MNNNKDRVVRCQNGHFYDGVAYAFCPHCRMAAEPKKTETEAPEKPSIWPWGHKNEKKYESEGAINSNDTKTVPLNYESVVTTEPINKPQVTSFSDDMGTVPLYYGGMSANEQVKEQIKEPVIGYMSESVKAPVKELEKEYMNASENELVNEPVRETEYDSDKTEMVSYAASTVDVTDTNSYDDERTIGYFEAANKNEQVLQDLVSVASFSSTTIAQTNSMSKESEEEAKKDKIVVSHKLSGPVVGWIVSIKGAYFGEYFGITVGNNSVGRNESNKICFSKDRMVSREKHAIITYEPKKREFFVKAGDESGLVYLNDELIMGSHRLRRMDKLEIGDGLYLFIPLCGEEFTWDDYMNKE